MGILIVLFIIAGVLLIYHYFIRDNSDELDKTGHEIRRRKKKPERKSETG